MTGPIWSLSRLPRSQKWKTPQSCAGSVEDGIADGWGHADNGSLARPGRTQISAIQQNDFDLRDITESGHPVAGEIVVEYFAVLESDAFEQRASETLDRGALHLVAQLIGIHDRATLEGLNNTEGLDVSR